MATVGEVYLEAGITKEFVKDQIDKRDKDKNKMNSLGVYTQEHEQYMYWLKRSDFILRMWEHPVNNLHMSRMQLSQDFLKEFKAEMKKA